MEKKKGVKQGGNPVDSSKGTHRGTSKGTDRTAPDTLDRKCPLNADLDCQYCRFYEYTLLMGGQACSFQIIKQVLIQMLINQGAPK